MSWLQNREVRWSGSGDVRSYGRTEDEKGVSGSLSQPLSHIHHRWSLWAENWLGDWSSRSWASVQRASPKESDGEVGVDRAIDHRCCQGMKLLPLWEQDRKWGDRRLLTFIFYVCKIRQAINATLTQQPSHRSPWPRRGSWCSLLGD